MIHAETKPVAHGVGPTDLSRSVEKIVEDNFGPSGPAKTKKLILELLHKERRFRDAKVDIASRMLSSVNKDGAIIDKRIIEVSISRSKEQKMLHYTMN